MADQYELSAEEKADQMSDVWAALATITVVVCTAAFWLLGQ